MKKEINLLRILLLSAAVIVLASVFVFFSFRNRVDYSKLTEVSISRSNVLAAAHDRYTLTRKNGSWIAAWQSDFLGPAYETVVDEAFAAKVKDILAEHKVHKWDGYDVDLTYVHDATGVDFYMRFSDGKEITASGYAANPKNFYSVFEKFKTLFEDLY